MKWTPDNLVSEFVNYVDVVLALASKRSLGEPENIIYQMLEFLFPESCAKLFKNLAMCLA